LSWERGKEVKIMVRNFKYKCTADVKCESKKGKFCSKRSDCEHKVNT
jgi:hypothetical protein